MAQWKPVVLNNDVLAGGIDGLVGIEELDSYSDLDILKKSSCKNSKIRKKETLAVRDTSSKKKKRKVSGVRRIGKHTHKQNAEGLSEPNSDLMKMRSWSEFGIRNELLQSLCEKQFFEPTEIQLRSLGSALCGKRDILGAAETGSGKTLAFGIPIVNGILNIKETMNDDDDDDEDSGVDEQDWEKPGINMGCVRVMNLKQKKKKNQLFALILTPTRELAVQVKDHLMDLCKYTNIRIALVVGGLAHEKQERLLNKRPEIVVATPGRLWELICDGNIHLQRIENVRYLAIDETDRMLERGHFEELGKLLEKINFNDKTKERRQNFVFSATLTVVHDPPSHLKGKKRKRVTPGQKLQQLMDRVGITNPKIVDITTKEVTAENLSEFKIVCKFEEKDYYLYHFICKYPGRIIIFCNSIGCVKRLASLLTVMHFKPLPLHANMEQKQRLRNLDKFRGTANSLLLATDVAARGLDIPNVDHVIHYQVPRTAESYVHRSGRTARGHKSGSALLLIEPQEYNSYLKLIHTLGRQRDVEDLVLESDTMNHIRNVVHLARDIDQLSLALKKENSAQSWYRKAVDAMDLVIDDDEMPKKVSSEANSRIRRDLTIKQKQLKSLLGRPAVPRLFSGKFPDTNISKCEPMTDIRRDRLKIPGAFVLRKVPV